MNDPASAASGRAQKSSSVRRRAAWLYHHHQMTQSEIADRLGVSRATVVRMLEDARRRNEVQVRVTEPPDECLALALRLEQKFSLNRVIVAPGTDDPTISVAAALGSYLSDVLRDGMSVGIGWGRTLSAALRHLEPDRQPNTTVAALMGGLIHPEPENPIEASWRLAGQLGAKCLLYLAPVIVDSLETKQALMQNCGLSEIEEAAKNLDLAVVSCGDIGPQSSSLAKDIVGSKILAQLIARGAVCDVMCNFIDDQGNSVTHPIANQTMSVDLDTLATAKNLVLASGGAHRARALHAAINRLQPTTLITDEKAAMALLD